VVGQFSIADVRVGLEHAPTVQAALDGLRPSAYQLCATAQHVLGQTILGSQIDPAHMVVRVRAGDRLLAFTGEAALLWAATMPPAALRASIDRLLREITERSATP
jgi:hypothetical protein